MIRYSTGIERVFFLGAGFSAAAGMPLLTDLPRRTFQYARSLPLYIEAGKLEPDGQGRCIIDLLKHYYPFLRSTRRRLVEGMPRWFDFEHFMSLVSSGSFFEERTGERWDSQTNQDLSLIRSHLAAVVTLPLVERAIPKVYLEFARRLSGGKSLIVSFNWDILLERALGSVGVPFTYDLKEWIKSDYKSTMIMKMHGSVNWFAEEDIKWRKSPWYRETFEIGEWIPGIRYLRADPASLLKCYSDWAAPIIVAPGFDKLRIVEKLGELWIRPWQLVQNDLDVVVIGLSLRDDDYHTRAFLYPQLVYGTRHHKLQVRVIDMATDERARSSIRRRYRCVRGVRFRFDGFNEESLASIWS